MRISLVQRDHPYPQRIGSLLELVGQPARVTLDGRERKAHVSVEQDPARAADVFRGLLEDSGTRAMGVKVNVDHAPTVEEIKPVLA
jgi:hypothetical protein